jgi:hypothetical protein
MHWPRDIFFGGKSIPVQHFSALYPVEFGEAQSCGEFAQLEDFIRCEDNIPQGIKDRQRKTNELLPMLARSNIAETIPDAKSMSSICAMREDSKASVRAFSNFLISFDHRRGHKGPNPCRRARSGMPLLLSQSRGVGFGAGGGANRATAAGDSTVAALF